MGKGKTKGRSGHRSQSRATQLSYERRSVADLRSKDYPPWQLCLACLSSSPRMHSFMLKLELY